MNKAFGIILILLATGSVAEEPQESVKPIRIHEYKMIDGKNVRQGPLIIRYNRTSATPRMERIRKGRPATHDNEVILTAACGKDENGEWYSNGLERIKEYEQLSLKSFHRN